MFTTHYERVTSWDRLKELESQMFVYVDLSEHPKFQELGLTGTAVVKIKPGEGYQLERTIKDYIPTVQDIEKLFEGKETELTAWVAGYEWWIRIVNKTDNEVWLVRLRPADRTFMLAKGNSVLLVYNPKNEFEMTNLRTFTGKFVTKPDRFVEEFKKKKDIVETNLHKPKAQTGGTTTVASTQKTTFQVNLADLFDDVNSTREEAIENSDLNLL